MKAKIKVIISRLIKKIFKQINLQKVNTTIFEAQRKLAFEDGQKFIYDNSSTNTMIFDGGDSFQNFHEFCLNKISKKGLIFEFGVYKGRSINFIAKNLKEKNDNRLIYGFDSFRGFSEEWTGMNEKYNTKYFSQEGNHPTVLKNVKLIDGFIEDTLPIFINENNIDYISLIRIDTDTYSPAKVILSNLKEFLVKGTIIIFDEFCGYPNWRSHEFKALNEEIDRNQYEFIGFAQNNSMLTQAAIKII